MSKNNKNNKDRHGPDDGLFIRAANNVTYGVGTVMVWACYIFAALLACAMVMS